jgi:predicted AlkP superfamily pyrophosphatase or phosphodiesterase
MSLFRAFAACLFLLAGCATAPAPVAEKRVILVSIDGFRADYLDRGLTPTLSALAADGARAEGGMRPSFPSVTFPNHYTLVTGLRPDEHGIVNNTMTDPAYPGAVFRLSDRAESTNPRWWNGAEPAWVTAEKHGVRTATMYWPGSEVEIRGVRPHDWLPFDQSMPSMKRAEQVLTWMDRPPAERPKLVTLYFDIVDTQGHAFGPDSPEVNAAVGEVDAAMGALVAGLEARGLAASTDIVVVADHGMAPLSPERQIQLDDIISPTLIDVPWMAGYLLGVVPAEGKTAEVEAALLGRHGALQCWRKGEIPARFHYGTNPRIPPIFCSPDTGWNIVSASRPSRWASKGAHGYDNDAPEMRALFLAHGPDFRQGARVATFDNVDVYPLLMGLIGVPPEKNDGDVADLAGALR